MKCLWFYWSSECTVTRPFKKVSTWCQSHLPVTKRRPLADTTGWRLRATGRRKPGRASEPGPERLPRLCTPTDPHVNAAAVQHGEGDGVCPGMMVRMQLFPSGAWPWHPRGATGRREDEGQPQHGSLLLCVREAPSAVGSSTPHTTPDVLLTASRHQPADTPCSFKKCLLTLTPDHSPPTTHSAKGGAKWTRDVGLTVVPFKPAPVTANRPSLAGEQLLPRKPSAPSTE